jgi:hypothetical protein
VLKRRNFLTGAAALAAYAPLIKDADALTAGQQLLLPGGASGVVADVTPAAFRTSTQTMIVGQFGGTYASIPQLLSEWSINIWGRQPTSSAQHADGYYFNMVKLRAAPPTAAVATGAGAANVECLALYYSGQLAGTTLCERFALTGVDKDGNRLSAGTTAGIGHAGYGYYSEQHEALNGHAVLLTVQYRAGKIELWATYRSMRPRLLIQQACTYNGTVSASDVAWGAQMFGSFNNGPEVEMPIVIPDRSLSEHDIAQLADGVSPELLGGATGKASAAIKFATVINGGSTTSDVVTALTPTDGQTVTLNGDVYTFRASPSLANDVQIVADVTATSADTGTNTITLANHGIPNGRRVGIRAPAQPGGINAMTDYFVVNTTTNTFQLSLTNGGSPITITNGGGGTVTILGTIATIDNLVTKLNALTPSSGGASNASYTTFSVDTLIATHRVAGGTSFPFNTTATAKMPTNKRLALAWVYITDYTNYNDGLLGAVGVFRTRNNPWVTPTLGELAPNTQVTGSMRVTSWGSGMVSQHRNGTGNLALSGIYTGVKPTGLQVKITDKSDNSTVQDWTTCTAFTVDTTAKTWTAKLTVPKGKRWLCLQTRKLGSTQVTQHSEVRWGVGEVIIMHGDSLQQMMVAGLSLITPNGFTSRFVGTGTVLGSSTGFWPADNAWHRFTSSAQIGAGEAVLANKISNDDNCVVALLNRSVAASTIASLTGTGVATSYLADLGNSFSDGSAGPLCGFFLLDCGTADAGTAVGPKLDAAYSWLRSNFGSEIAFGINSLANRRDAAPDYTQGVWVVRQAQINWLAGKSADPLVIDLGDADFYWSNTTDGAHPADASDPELKGELQALSVLRYRGVASYSGVGPVLLSAARSGAVITLTWSLNGATGLQTPNAGNITGADVVLASNNFTARRAYVTANAATDKIGWPGHTLVNGDPVFIGATGLQPGGLVSGTQYFVVGATAGVDFQVSLTNGGAAIDITSAGSSVIAVSNKDLLAQASHVVATPTTTTLTLAADPGAPVAINYLWGRPGRRSSDPNPSIDTTGVTTMTTRTAQDNILCDNFPLAFSNSHVPGRSARPTVSPVVTPT